MDVAAQKEQFYATIFPSRPNEWEVDDIFERLSRLDSPGRQALLDHVGAIWPVSHSLCFAYLTDGVGALEMFPADLLSEWVRQILGHYEKTGLVGARRFMAEVDNLFLGPMRGEAAVAFDEILPTMSHYIRGISARSFEFGVSSIPMSDTRTLFMPERLDCFPDKIQNRALYKLLVSLQWAHVESRIFEMLLDSSGEGDDPFSPYPDRKLAIDLFAILLAGRAFGLLRERLPGLYRRSRRLCRTLFGEVTGDYDSSGKAEVLSGLLGKAMGFSDAGFASMKMRPELSPYLPDDFRLSELLSRLASLYKEISPLPGTYRLGGAAFLLGYFDFQESGRIIVERRREGKDRFLGLLASFMDQSGRESDAKPPINEGKMDGQEQILMLLQKLQGPDTEARKLHLTIANDGLQIPEELAAVISDIIDDFGHLPQSYVQAAAGIGGSGMNFEESGPAADDKSVSVREATSYDEWDYRRGGYRASWCTLYEKSVHPVRSNFVAATLEKYRPQLVRLRRQFEMLRSRRRFVRRRRHGDDIDIDALIDALGDSRANRSPSDRLFIRLRRDERDITAMFLVDMSNSTEGWVGVAVKEALVLLAESLEIVGDRYAIYGFSGMRRSKSELFRIKGLDELYGNDVKGRIGAMMPMEYTRMGPPIRHLTKKLLDTHSRVRLLVVISDGKPEDYDDYKGRYAIEDTRKALLEARGYGLYPFCITIDKSAHDYLSHMFGRGNYIFVDNVKALPEKMAEMYRLLTS